MKIYYVYIVECSDGLYYTGVTNNLENRIVQHNEGKDKEAFTYTRRPVTLKWHEQFISPQEAIKIEKQIKGWSRKKKLAIIENRWHDLPKLSRNYAEKSSSTSSD